ncbi:MAG: bifunctional metallophosphatase/5'-nucleotidase [Cyanothece sp. SIO2G6]|nr:bifunctional metallophosphatase/5'-nucleotidase [Cyanothece sp. SIO2G6]
MAFNLQLLHTSDLEGGVDAITSAPNFAAVVEALESDAANQAIASILISSGDNYLPGPFFSAAGDRALRDPLQSFYQDFFNESGLDNIREGSGRIDISIMNALGFDASAVGNHEFDAGTTAFADIVGTDIRGDDLDDVRWLGAQFPYLSANLDFSLEDDLSGLFTSNILPNTAFQSTPDDLTAAGNAPKIAPATVIERGGERIGVVGATTQIVESITSTGNVTVNGVSENNMAVLAGFLQPVINDLINGDDNIVGTADDVNKIILTTHLQQIALEQELAPLLTGVDIIIAGGSDVLLADSTDRLRAGDTANGSYPIITAGGDANPVAIVSTDGQYNYVGRLVVTFNDNGVIDTTSIDANVSGAYATDDQGVSALWGAADPFAAGTKGAQVQSLVTPVQDIVTARDGVTFGSSDVYLEGRRSFVRTEETNLGNLTADANLFVAQQFDPTVQISIKNGGGIRAEIGAIDGTTGELLPTEANSLSGKQAGQISQLDIEGTLRFNNELTLLTVTAEELKNLLEHGVAASGDGNTPGQFPQVGGLTFSFDISQQAIEFDDDGNITTPGSRVRSLGITNDEGQIVDLIVRDGVVVGDPNREIRLVTLDFLADGGDSYPFDVFGENRVDLASTLTDPGAATSADPGTEQDALAEFLLTNFNGGTPFSAAETPASEDSRIQNLTLRADDIPDNGFSIPGTNGRDRFTGGDGDDEFLGRNGNDNLRGQGGDDLIAGNRGNDRLFGQDGDDTLSGGGGRDRLDGGNGSDDLSGDGGRDRLNGGNGRDTLTGGRGSDVYIGGRSADIFVLEDLGGRDLIRDFGTGNDRLGLSDGISFSDLEFVQAGNSVQVSLVGGGLLAIIRSTAVEELTSDVFTSV